MNFALIGCGRISGKHVDALTSIDGADLVACADINISRAKTVGERIGVPWYGDYDEMLRSHPETDVVSVLTPSGLHAQHTVDIATRYGKHIVVEKPMALRLADADAMIRACDEAAARLFVVKQNRFNLPVVRLRQALESGRFGKLIMGTVRVRWRRDQSYYDQDPWRGTWAMDGGVFSNQASHHVDLLEWMLGQPVSVMARTGTFLSDIEVEDTGVAILRFENGAIGVIEATTATRPKDLEGSISLLGEHGTVEIAGFAVNKLRTWEFEDATEDEKAEVFRTAAENPPDVYGFGHRRYIEHVINAIETGTKGLVEGLDGRRSLELINAIYESAETGKEVFLRYEPRYSKLGRR
jgi:UDP-N-acetyl-2-amino-2-deoxyglucuronate dehydrogenase